jgi:DNA-3-methyladenine glycosylase II
MNSLEIRKGVKYLKSKDKILAKIIDEVGECKLKQSKDYFQVLLRSIIGQQLSYYAARKINERFLSFFANKPEPRIILNTSNSRLRELGISRNKIIYIKDLCLKYSNGEITFNQILEKSNEEIIILLTKVKGIGLWTAQMFLIFTLGRSNVLPFTDLSLRNSIKIHYGLRKLPKEKKILNISRKNCWSPYCSIASWYLWRKMEL